MNHKVAAQFKKLLLARREDVSRRLIQPQGETIPAHLSDDPTEIDPAPSNPEPLDQNARALLVQMDAALARIASGIYGECIGCGKEIGTKRLVAFPCTRYCLACESNLHRQR
jgi:RNA polymerase-binding transcription factor DksA